MAIVCLLSVVLSMAVYTVQFTPSRCWEHIAKKWTMPVQNWKAALQRFAILLGDRVPQDALA